VNRRLAYTDFAKADLENIATYIAEESGSSDVAEAFIVKLDEKCRRLISLPGTLGTARMELRHDIRSTPHRDYVIFFRYRGNLLEVVSIVHGSRDVTSWFGTVE